MNCDVRLIISRRLVGWLPGCLVGWLAGWPGGWWIDCLCSTALEKKRHPLARLSTSCMTLPARGQEGQWLSILVLQHQFLPAAVLKSNMPFPGRSTMPTSGHPGLEGFEDQLCAFLFIFRAQVLPIACDSHFDPSLRENSRATQAATNTKAAQTKLSSMYVGINLQ